MIISYNWLKEFVDFDFHINELARHLTMVGLEVDSVKHVDGSGGLIGEIINLKKNDGLVVLNIDVGGRIVSISTDIKNLGLHKKIALVKSNDIFKNAASSEDKRFINEWMILKYTDLGFNIDEVITFDNSFENGLDLDSIEEFNDYIIDVDLTPNRADALSMLGIAREICGFTNAELKLPNVEYDVTNTKIENFIYAKIKDGDLCKRYCLYGADVSIDESLFFIKSRLIKCGIRPINNIVDITNYVLLALGQPLHAFDINKITGGVTVRRSKNEKILVLDGKIYDLNNNMLAITDEKGPIAIAGIMGAEDSKVDNNTKYIAVESAYFDPVNIRLTARHLKLHSEASHRFERGVDPNLCTLAAKYAMKLINSYYDGKPFQTHYDIRESDFASKEVKCSTLSINNLLGSNFSKGEMIDKLRTIGFSIKDTLSDEFLVHVPTYRFDVSIEADIAEEVARLFGYDSIKTTMPVIHPTLYTKDNLDYIKDTLLDILPTFGLHEVINYSFVNEGKLELFDKVKSLFINISNPLSEDQMTMRTNLTVSLMENLKTNINRGVRSIAIFEMAKVFFKDNSYALESDHVGFLMYGNKPANIHNKGAIYDFYDIKGVFESIFNILNLKVSFCLSNLNFMHPKRSVYANVNKNVYVGYFGEIHPDIYEKYSIPFNNTRILVGEIDLKKLVDFIDNKIEYTSLPKFPTVLRDLSIIVDKDVDSLKIENLIKNNSYVYRVVLIDYYNKLVEKSKKSLTYRISLKNDSKTFTDEEIDVIIKDILHNLKLNFNAQLRG